MFENMPQVPKGKGKMGAQSSSPNRFPWIIGVVGCLVLLLCVALAGLTGGGAWFFTSGPGAGLVPKAANQPSGGTQPGVAGTPVAAAIPRGKIAYSVETGGRPEDKFVYVMNADGTGAKQLLTNASSPAFSPDGTLIAYYHWNDGIYVANADGTQPRKIVGETNAKYLEWSHDGKSIAFSSQPGGKGNINIDVVLSNGGGRRSVVIGGSIPSWSPDDKEIVFQTCRGADCGIYRVGILGGEPVRIVGDLGGTPVWSPDGKKVAYHADTDQVKQLFVVNADGTGRRQITSGADIHVDPQWSPDGNYIFYRSPEGGSWAIWRVAADGASPTRIAPTDSPVDWAYERLAVSK